MSAIDYSKTQIYKLSCNDSAVKQVFVGATVNLRQQKSYIRRLCNANKQTEPYYTINSNGGFDNWKIVILEEFKKCSNKNEMNIRVGVWENRIKNGWLTPNDSGLTPIDSDPAPIDSGLAPIDSNFTSQKPEISEKFSVHNAEETTDKNDKAQHICNLCNKVFTRKNNLHRHMKDRCRKYHQLELENKALKQQLQESQLQLVAKKSSNNTNNNSNNDSSNSNNTTTNTNTNSHNTVSNSVSNTVNNYNIMSFGEEDFGKIYDSKKKRLAILKQKHSALLYKIEQSRCNKDHPEFRNVVIKNLRSDIAHVYKNNIDPNNFIVMSIEDVLDLIMRNDYTEIETDFEEIGHELDVKSRERTGEFIRQMNEDPDKMKQQKQSIKRMIYNLNKDVKIKNV